MVALLNTKEYEDRFANPFVAAEMGFIDDVIRPRNTRKRLATAFASLRNKDLQNPWKKHDNIPYEKTAADIQSDNKFVKETIELAGGDAAKAAVSLVEIGWQRIGEGDPNHAIRAFNQAWLIQPDNPAVFWGFAVAGHIRNDDLATVTRWFNRTRQLIALKGLPENHRLEADEARVLAERGEHGKAKPLFKKALSIDPNYIPAHIGMMNIADALGDAELKQKHQLMRMPMRCM